MRYEPVGPTPCCSSRRNYQRSTGCSSRRTGSSSPSRSSRSAPGSGTGDASTLIVAAITVAAGLVFCGWEGLRDDLRQGAGVEPAAPAVLVPHAVPARGARRRRDWCGCLARASRGWSAATAVAPACRARASDAARRLTSPCRGAGGTGVGARHRRRPSPPASRVTASRLVAMAVLAAIVATVCLVNVQNRARLHPVLGQATTTPATRAAPPPTSPPSRGPSTARSSTPRTRSRRAACSWEGGDAIGAYGTPLALDAAAVLDRTGASSRWRGSTSRRRPRRRTTS